MANDRADNIHEINESVRQERIQKTNNISSTENTQSPKLSSLQMNVLAQVLFSLQQWADTQLVSGDILSKQIQASNSVLEKENSINNALQAQHREHIKTVIHKHSEAGNEHRWRKTKWHTYKKSQRTDTVTQIGTNHTHYGPNTRVKHHWTIRSFSRVWYTEQTQITVAGKAVDRDAVKTIISQDSAINQNITSAKAMIGGVIGSINQKTNLSTQSFSMDEQSLNTTIDMCSNISGIVAQASKAINS